MGFGDGHCDRASGWKSLGRHATGKPTCNRQAYAAKKSGKTREVGRGAVLIPSGANTSIQQRRRWEKQVYVM